jgi:hypothetical protein
VTSRKRKRSGEGGGTAMKKLKGKLMILWDMFNTNLIVPQTFAPAKSLINEFFSFRSIF